MIEQSVFNVIKHFCLVDICVVVHNNLWRHFPFYPSGHSCTSWETRISHIRLQNSTYCLFMKKYDSVIMLSSSLNNFYINLNLSKCLFLPVKLVTPDAIGAFEHASQRAWPLLSWRYMRGLAYLLDSVKHLL